MLSKETERTLQATLRLQPKISGNLQIEPFTHQDVPLAVPSIGGGSLSHCARNSLLGTYP